MASRPQWMRCDLSLFRNPKLAGAGPGAGWLYLSGLAYSVENLTDGWLPDWFPATIPGCGTEHAASLEDRGLWIPLEVTDDGGWLINDFPEYQVTKEQWEQMRERNRRNINKRWAKRHLRTVPDGSA